MVALQEWLPRLKTELNHLYFRPARQLGNETDLGWFCREHALHVHCVAQFLGHASQIVLGDFLLRCRPKSQETIEIVSIGETQQHAWCEIDGLAPVDVSMRVRGLAGGFTQAGDDVPPIIGVHGRTLHQPFAVLLFGEFPGADSLAGRSFKETCGELTPDSPPLIAYHGLRKIASDPLSLAADPYQIVCPPPAGKRTFLEIHGSDAFFALNAHFLQVARGEVKGFAPYRDPDNALAAILKRHGRAHASLQRYWMERQQARAV